MNNQSEKPEKLQPQDSKRKGIKHPQDDKETVLKSEDKTYTAKEADFKNPAKQREQGEQPFNDTKSPAK